MAFPKTVTLIEVGPREGFQFEGIGQPDRIATADKISLIEMLAGIPRGVLGSFALIVFAPAFKALFNRTRDWADLEAMVAAGRFSVEEAASAVAGIAGEDDPRVARLLSLVAT
jgi:hypothetical protein